VKNLAGGIVLVVVRATSEIRARALVARTEPLLAVTLLYARGLRLPLPPLHLYLAYFCVRMGRKGT
jgi:hypothetical protein